ncbi:MAG: Hsp70 family protein [Synergistaceae bacterium]|nr:Hsp70 family protein [Synergistaceae bacterium]
MSPANTRNDLCIGIDLGTTNSVLATVNVRPNGQVKSKVVDISRAYDVFNSALGEAALSTEKKTTLPSFVFYRQEKNYEPLVGDFAKRQYSLRPHLVAKSIKSQMGKPLAEGLSPDIPDKTPAQISSRILQHLLREASKIYHCPITDAVITVPANFDSVMCKATQDAAELAGISVRNPDGTEKPILLSEPNAIIYDLINQIQNGEISDIILDLSSMKRVLVFDLGGGTLDITLHEIKRRNESPDILKVDEIAANRYTLLGGDNFDEALAIEMFKRYKQQYSKNPGVSAQLDQKENIIMPQLRTYAEYVKVGISQQCSDDYNSGWYDEDEEPSIDTGGSMGGIGYSYSDNFKKSDIEAIFAPFMANNLKFDDYKNLESVKDTKNIIYPILDVLKKAADKLGTPDVKIDAVIVSGGMSKFYMINERLKTFFGFDPITALDPDLAVARGAAVYHYFLKQHSEIQDNMKIIGQELSSVPAEKAEKPEINQEILSPRINIELGEVILNDALYMGMKNGAVHMIIPTGAALPYESQIMTGFRIDPLQSRVAIPIKSRNIDGTYRTIANGNIEFTTKFSDGAYVAFIIHMNKSKVISMKAWTSNDLEGQQIIEEGTAEIAINSPEQSTAKVKMLPPKGTRLNALSEIKTFVQLCLNLSKVRSGRLYSISKQRELTVRIRDTADNIMNADNHSDFIRPILAALSDSNTNDEARMRLFTMIRRLSNELTDNNRRKLAEICIQQLGAEILGISMQHKGQRINANIQAIYALSICGTPEIMNRLETLHKKNQYIGSCLYSHAKTRTQLKWVISTFLNDMALEMRHVGNHLQLSAHAIAVSLRNDGSCPVSQEKREEILNALINGINSGRIRSDILVVCVLAVGTMCDRRFNPSVFSESKTSEAENCINLIPKIYPLDLSCRVERNSQVALKLIRGESLDEDEEKFLLTKLELDADIDI